MKTRPPIRSQSRQILAEYLTAEELAAWEGEERMDPEVLDRCMQKLERAGVRVRFLPLH
jgi:hypothetical protein